MKTNRICAGILIGVVLFIGTGCDWMNLNMRPTKERMTGLWKVTAATDEHGASILNNINFPVTALQLTGDNNVASTAGPMFMAIVYGTSHYVTALSQIDQVFNYNNLQLTNGEWACADGTPDRFTIEMTLQGLPGQTAFTDVLRLIGVNPGYLDQVIYHKFIDVKVELDDFSDSVMVWKFDDMTSAVYNKKDANLNYVLWGGWPTTSFGHYTFTLTKQASTLIQLIQSY
jgi:hypothetical protein